MHSLLMDADVKDLVSAVRSQLASAQPLARIRNVAESADALDPDAWSLLARQIGVQGLLVDPDRGGGGGDLRAGSAVAIELGAALTPGPVTATMLAGHVLALADPDDAAGLQARIAEGTLMADVLLREQHDIHAVRNVNCGVRLEGAAPAVLAGSRLDLLMLNLSLDGTAGLALVTDVHGRTHRRVSSLDITRRYDDVILDGSPARFVPIDSETDSRIVATSEVLLASSQLGLMQRCLADTVAYCQERFAFGRAVGSFQAVKHQLAELACVVAQADGLVSDAVASEHDSITEFSRASAAAVCWNGPRATSVASECLRLLGGIGYTWEHDAHLFFRRARVDEHALGDPLAHRRRLAGLLGLDGT